MLGAGQIQLTAWIASVDGRSEIHIIFMTTFWHAFVSGELKGS